MAEKKVAIRIIISLTASNGIVYGALMSKHIDTSEKPALAETRTHNAETLARFAVALEYAERYARLSAYLVSIGWNEKEFATAIAKGAELEAAK